MLPTPTGGGFSQPAGESFPGGTDTSSTGFALRERLAQPQPCVYGAASGEAAFKAAPRAIPLQGAKNGRTAFIPMPQGQGSSAGGFDKPEGRTLPAAFITSPVNSPNPHTKR